MLNVNDGDKVLLRRLDISDDVVKLLLRRHAGAVKMIAANAQSGTSGFSKVSPVGVIHIVGPFRCFEVNVGDVRASNHALPVNGALVMRNVNALFVFRVDISLMRIKRHALRSQGVAVLYGPYRHGVGFKHGANVFTSMFVAVFFSAKSVVGDQ